MCLSPNSCCASLDCTYSLVVCYCSGTRKDTPGTKGILLYCSLPVQRGRGILFFLLVFGEFPEFSRRGSEFRKIGYHTYPSATVSTKKKMKSSPHINVRQLLLVSHTDFAKHLQATSRATPNTYIHQIYTMGEWMY